VATVVRNLRAGDFFGEIAALTSVPRTASVIAEQPTTVLAVPAALRKLISETQINRVFLSKLTERMLHMQMVALPGFGGLDQETLRDLCTPVSRSAPEAQLAQATT
jgi:CRP-like cAMP-binding protein